MAGIFLSHSDNSHAIGTTFWREVKIDNFWELLFYQWDKNLIQCYSQDCRFIRWTSGVCAVIDWIRLSSLAALIAYIRTYRLKSSDYTADNLMLMENQ